MVEKAPKTVKKTARKTTGKATGKTVKKAAPKTVVGARVGRGKSAAPLLEDRPVTTEVAASEPAEVVEAFLLRLMREGSSDAARVSAAKALMDWVKYMNGENERAARSDDKARMEAIHEARRLLAEFAALKFGSAESAGPSGPAGAASMAEGGAAQPDHPAR